MIISKELHPALENLEPKLVWYYFNQLRQIPRKSGNEEGARNWLIDFAKENNFEHYTDSVGNVLIKIPGTEGYEDSKPVCIQNHMDMVCVKIPESNHDFSKDPIDLILDGDKLKANGTTLGADNGVGLCISLAIAMDKNISHPPLEILVTVDEEVGLLGADKLDPEALHMESRLVINLDNEETGDICIGCAGGQRFYAQKEYNRDESKGNFQYKIEIKNLEGGHSGIEIANNRANVFKIAHTLLKDVDLKIISINGGQAMNAIPSDCIIEFETQNMTDLGPRISEIEGYVLSNFDEKDISILVESITDKKLPFNKESSDEIMNLIKKIPHGVKSMNEKVPGLVKTSNNFAMMSTEDDFVRFDLFTRSGNLEEMKSTLEEEKDIFRELGYKIETDPMLVPWDGDPNDNIVNVAESAHRKVLEPENMPFRVMTIHAGLECGTIAAKFNEKVEAVSFGPEIRGAHTPEEYVMIKDTELIYEIVAEMLKNLK